MCKPPEGTQPGTMHSLKADGLKDRVYEWTGKAWSTPKTGWSTKPSAMATLGWRYGSAVQSSDDT